MPLHTETVKTLTITEARQLKALAHPVRAQILELLSQEPASAKVLAARMDVSHGKVGHHLKVLVDAGLIELAEERPVRAVVERFYRPSYDRLHIDVGAGQDPLEFMLRQAALEARPYEEQPIAPFGRIYSARMDLARAAEFAQRLVALADEFAAADQHHGPTFGFVGAVYEMNVPT